MRTSRGQLVSIVRQAGEHALKCDPPRRQAYLTTGWAQPASGRELRQANKDTEAPDHDADDAEDEACLRLAGAGLHATSGGNLGFGLVGQHDRDRTEDHAAAQRREDSEDHRPERLLVALQRRAVSARCWRWVATRRRRWVGALGRRRRAIARRRLGVVGGRVWFTRVGGRLVRRHAESIVTTGLTGTPAGCESGQGYS